VDRGLNLGVEAPPLRAGPRIERNALPNAVEKTSKSPTRIGVASNVRLSWLANPSPNSPVRNRHTSSSSPTFAGVICAAAL